MRQRAIAFTLATGMALAGVTLPDVAHADREDDDRNPVNARNDTICCAVPGSTLRISFSTLLNNDSGRHLRVLSAHLIRGFGRDVVSFHVNKRSHFIVIVFRNRIRDNFVNFVYRIAGRGGRDSAIVRIRREPVSAS